VLRLGAKGGAFRKRQPIRSASSMMIASGRGLEVFDHDAHVIHAFDRHVLDAGTEPP
jgi:hypothetical protein